MPQITMTEGSKGDSVRSIMEKVIIEANAAHECEKMKLTYIMEQSHKAGRMSFDLDEFLNYYRDFSGLAPESDSRDAVDERSLFHWQWEYYVIYPELRSARELAVKLNQIERSWE